MAIDKLKMYKASGPDGIPAELIKAGGEKLIEKITECMRKTYYTTFNISNSSSYHSNRFFSCRPVKILAFETFGIQVTHSWL